MVYVEVAIIVALILLNGFLAMSELAVVSSRLSRLKTLQEQGAYGSRRALILASDPGRFLSSVQIGITLVGVASGAFSGATLGLRLSAWLETQGVSTDIAEALGVGIVVAIITYASLIVGELVPKQIALRNPEAVALKVAPIMTYIAKAASPLVWLLDASGDLVLKLLRRHREPDETMTAEEVRTVIAEAETAGVLEADERRMISGVMRLGDRPVKGIMTPRSDVDWIDLQADEAEIREILKNTSHSRLPAGHGIDDIIGVVQTRELLSSLLAGKPLDVRGHVRTAPVVHDNAEALDVLTALKSSPVPMGLVHDEYGHFEGIVTAADVMEAIVGVFRSDTDELEPPAVRRADGSWLLAGYLPADEMADHLIIALPEKRDYQTLGGFMLANLGHLPVTGETFDALGWRFEVVDMDGRRIDKVLATRLPATRRPAVRAQASARG
jgi:putative hemolysin